MTAPTASTSLPPLQLLSAHKCHGGQVQFVRHLSSTTLTPMTFSVFVPPQAQAGPVPVLYFLSGLSCTAENFTTKAAAQKYCAQHGILLVAPDTSPRGAGVPTEDDSYDLGTGAGFYVNATEAPWAPRYRMYDYVTRELPALVAAHFSRARGPSFDLWTLDGRAWGADLRAEKIRGCISRVSAFAPICAPSLCPWGQKAFTAYLGTDRAAWAAYDASELLKSVAVQDVPGPILIDQGDADGFLKDQLHPQVLLDIAQQRGIAVDYRLHASYDHGYYFITTFVEDHIAHHARALHR
jgi:S-formylglutathione hydrolase